MLKKTIFLALLVVVVGLLGGCGESTPDPKPEAVNPASPAPVASTAIVEQAGLPSPGPTEIKVVSVAPTEIKVAATATAVPTFSPTSAPLRVTASSTQAPTPSPSAVRPTSSLIIAPTPTPDNPLRPGPSLTASVNPLVTTTSGPVATVNAAGPDAEEQTFLQLLNSYRQSQGLVGLTFEPLLFRSARWLAQDMASKNYVAHTDSQGRDIFARIKAFGYTGSHVGENIAGGIEKAAPNLEIWQSDDVHKNNLLGASYSRVGVGRAYAKDSANRWYWVLDLG